MTTDHDMTANIADTAIGALALHRFRFTLESVERLSLPIFSGSEFHGGLGMMLARHAPDAYQDLFAERESSRPRPYALYAHDLGRPLEAGEALTLDLTLIGAAAAHFHACFNAMMLLGEAGIGKNRGRFCITDVQTIKTSEDEQVFSRATGHALFWDSTTRVSEILSVSSTGPASACTVKFVTPLRLKQANELVRTPPSLDMLLHRILSRTAQLAGVPLPAIRHQIREIAHPARIAHHDTRWQEWSRYSARQRKAMPFGGLVGSVRYEGKHLQAIVPWLRLAEWLHVGNKTTFGLGACRVTPHA
jgi:hypothetical protein